jgi:hypothetical protein
MGVHLKRDALQLASFFERAHKLSQVLIGHESSIMGLYIIADNRKRLSEHQQSRNAVMEIFAQGCLDRFGYIHTNR